MHTKKVRRPAWIGFLSLLLLLLQGCSSIRDIVNPPPVYRGLTPQEAANYLNQITKSPNSKEVLSSYYRQEEKWEFYDGSTWNCNHRRTRVVETGWLLTQEPDGKVIFKVLTKGDCEKTRVDDAIGIGKFDGQFLYFYYSTSKAPYIHKFKSAPATYAMSKVQGLTHVGSLGYVDEKLQWVPPPPTYSFGSQGTWNYGAPRDAYSSEIFLSSTNIDAKWDVESVFKDLDENLTALTGLLSADSAEIARNAARIRSDNAQASREIDASMRAHIQKNVAENAAILNKVDRQTNAAYAETNRRLAAQAAERARVQAEQDERGAERRRQLARERSAREEAEHQARTKTAAVQSALPKYQPQVVNIPTGRQTCPAGYSPARHPNGEYKTIPPAAYCVKDPQSTRAQTSTQGPEAGRQADAANGSAGPTRSSQRNPANVEDAKKKTVEWGQIQLEAVAICHQSQKSKKWECNGALDNQIIVDEPTLESALKRQHCAGGTWSAGGPTINGVQWDAYRCGHSLGAGDYDVAKKHGLITARRSYRCPKNQPGDGRCSTIYTE